MMFLDLIQISLLQIWEPGQREMAWMMDQYSRNSGMTVNGVVTGKARRTRWVQQEELKPQGSGVMVSTLSALEKLKINPYNSTVAVQGFGNVGSHAAQLLVERGAKIIAIQ